MPRPDTHRIVLAAFGMLLCASVVVSATAGHAVAAERFAQWVARLWPEAKARGISRATFDRAFAGMTPDCGQPDVFCGRRGGARPTAPTPRSRGSGLPESCNRVSQKEFLEPSKYFPPNHLRHLSRRGREILADIKSRQPQAYRHIRNIEKNFRISRYTLMGLWGRETSFGDARLDHNAVRALASSAFAGIRSRRRWSRRQLLAALKMVDRGDVTLAAFRSSYAGATGLTQIMPGEYLRFAVDGDLDGRRDIWTSIADSMATTANILKDRGWRSRERSWGYEVVQRRGRPLLCTMEGSANRWPIRRWMKEYGLVRVPRRDIERPVFPNSRNRGYLLMPAGARGPAFIVTANFDVLRRYNPSELYALFVGHLGDRVGCDTDKRECRFYTPWPRPGPDDFDFSVANLCRLQMALIRRGFLDGPPDGLFGPLTRVAIGRYQTSRNRRPDCYPSKTLFDELVNGIRTRAAVP